MGYGEASCIGFLSCLAGAAFWRTGSSQRQVRRCVSWLKFPRAVYLESCVAFNLYILQSSSVLQLFQWTQAVENSTVTIPQLKEAVVDVLSMRSPRFKVCFRYFLRQVSVVPASYALVWSQTSVAAHGSPALAARAASEVECEDELSPTRPLSKTREEMELAAMAPTSFPVSFVEA